MLDVLDSAIIGRSLPLFKKHLIGFVAAMPLVSLPLSLSSFVFFWQHFRSLFLLLFMISQSHCLFVFRGRFDLSFFISLLDFLSCWISLDLLLLLLFF